MAGAAVGVRDGPRRGVQHVSVSGTRVAREGHADRPWSRFEQRRGERSRAGGVDRDEGGPGVREGAGEMGAGGGEDLGKRNLELEKG